MFLQRVSEARAALQRGAGVKLEDAIERERALSGEGDQQLEIGSAEEGPAHPAIEVENPRRGGAALQGDGEDGPEAEPP